MSREFYLVHYDLLPHMYRKKSCVSSIRSLTDYETIKIDSLIFPAKKWEDYRFDMEVNFGMHPFCKYDQVTRSCFAVNDSSTWKQVGFVVGYLIYSERDDKDKGQKKTSTNHWWFQEYPQVSCNYVPEPNDVILILQCHVRPPPLTQHKSLFASTYTLQEAFKKFMYIPKMEYNPTLKEMLLDDVKKWDKDVYKEASQHSSTLPEDLLCIRPDDWKACGCIHSIFIDMYLNSISDRYFLPTVEYFPRMRF